MNSYQNHTSFISPLFCYQYTCNQPDKVCHVNKSTHQTPICKSSFSRDVYWLFFYATLMISYIHVYDSFHSLTGGIPAALYFSMFIASCQIYAQDFRTLYILVKLVTTMAAFVCSVCRQNKSSKYSKNASRRKQTRPQCC